MKIGPDGFSRVYDQRVSVQHNEPDDGASGQPVAHWVTKFKHWANVMPRGGTEKRVFYLLRAEIEYLVRLRFNSLSQQILPADWRIVLPGGEILNIDSRIDVETRRREFEYRCIEVPQK